MEKAGEEQVITLCQELIRQRSYSGEEAGVVKVLSEHMKEMGFDEVTVDRYGNIIGCIKGSRPGKKILFDGHIDTVPVTEERETKAAGPFQSGSPRAPMDPATFP